MQDGPLGALYLENGDITAQFDGADVATVTSFCDFVALALAKTRNLEALQKREEQLRRSRERIGRLNARLKKILQRQTHELAGVRADLDVSRHELGIRYDYSAIVGQSPAMRGVLALLDRVIESELPVLVTGESGTGKELMARAVHYNGQHRDGRLVAVNCAAIPADLIEAEFFGREAGAFTGAGRVDAGACSSRRTAARCSSTRSRRPRSTCRPSCCACWRRGSCAASAGRSRFRSRCGRWPRPTRICAP